MNQSQVVELKFERKNRIYLWTVQLQNIFYCFKQDKGRIPLAKDVYNVLWVVCVMEDGLLRVFLYEQEEM